MNELILQSCPHRLSMVALPASWHWHGNGKKCGKLPADLCVVMKTKRFGVFLLAMSISMTLAGRAADICTGAAASGNGTGADWNNKFGWTGTLVRGNTYYLEDGTYAAKVLSVAESGSTVITIRKATVAAHASATGWSDSMGDGQAVFAHNRVTTYGGNCLWIQSGYWTLDGVTGRGNVPGAYGFKLAALNPPTEGANAYGSRIFISTGSHLNLAHLEFEAFPAGDYGRGAIEQASSGNWDESTVSDCWFSGAQYLVGLNSTHNVTLEYLWATNSFSSASHHGDLINMKMVSAGNPCTNITIRNCVFANHSGTGGVSANDTGATGVSADYIYIYGNVFGGQLPTNYNGGNGYIGATTRGGLEHTYVYNNTFLCYATDHDAWLGITGQGGTVCVASNTLIYGLDARDKAATWKSDHNWFVNCINTNALGEGNSRFGTGDPFVNAAQKNYHLTASSPGGVSLPSPFNTDPDSVTRGGDGTWDHGAYEYGGVLTNPAVAVSPSSLNFSSALTNTTRDLSFTVVNIGAGTLAGSASVAAPFSIVSGATYSLGANQTQSVTVRYQPTVAGSNSQNVSFTGGGGVNVAVIGLATTTNANLAPLVSAISHNAIDVNQVTMGLQTFEGSTIQLSGSASDPDGDPLTWQWLYALNGGADVVYEGGAGTATPVSFTYRAGAGGSTYVWKLRVSDGLATAESQLTVGVLAVGLGDSIEAESGVIAVPFVSVGGFISQTSTTGIADGGRATYAITITNAGDYVIRALVNAPSFTANSFYINIDAEPQDPAMAWDILPPTVGFETRLVTWRGGGTADADEFVPKAFTLATGPHQLVIRGREANTQLDSIALVKLPPRVRGFRQVLNP